MRISSEQAPTLTTPAVPPPATSGSSNSSLVYYITNPQLYVEQGIKQSFPNEAADISYEPLQLPVTSEQNPDYPSVVHNDYWYPKNPLTQGSYQMDSGLVSYPTGQQTDMCHINMQLGSDVGGDVMLSGLEQTVAAQEPAYQGGSMHVGQVAPLPMYTSQGGADNRGLAQDQTTSPGVASVPPGFKPINNRPNQFTQSPMATNYALTNDVTMATTYMNALSMPHSHTAQNTMSSNDVIINLDGGAYSQQLSTVPISMATTCVPINGAHLGASYVRGHVPTATDQGPVQPSQPGRMFRYSPQVVMTMPQVSMATNTNTTGIYAPQFVSAPGGTAAAETNHELSQTRRVSKDGRARPIRPCMEEILTEDDNSLESESDRSSTTGQVLSAAENFSRISVNSGGGDVQTHDGEGRHEDGNVKQVGGELVQAAGDLQCVPIVSHESYVSGLNGASWAGGWIGENARRAGIQYQYNTCLNVPNPSTIKWSSQPGMGSRPKTNTALSCKVPHLPPAQPFVPTGQPFSAVGQSYAMRSPSYAPGNQSYASVCQSYPPRSQSYAPCSQTYASVCQSYPPRSQSYSPGGPVGPICRPYISGPGRPLHHPGFSGHVDHVTASQTPHACRPLYHSPLTPVSTQALFMPKESDIIRHPILGLIDRNKVKELLMRRCRQAPVGTPRKPPSPIHQARQPLPPSTPARKNLQAPSVAPRLRHRNDNRTGLSYKVPQPTPLSATSKPLQVSPPSRPTQSSSPTPQGRNASKLATVWQAPSSTESDIGDQQCPIDTSEGSTSGSRLSDLSPTSSRVTYR